VCVTGRCKFAVQSQPLDITSMDKVFGTIEVEDEFAVRLDRPRFAAGVCGRDDDKYFSDRPDTHPITFAHCSDLLLNAIPIHGVNEEGLDYIKRFQGLMMSCCVVVCFSFALPEEDPTYTPCILLAAHRRLTQYGTNVS
jgi:hypothetical protein